MHTQAAYQLMLPEAIAIVMAPQRRPDNGTFALSQAGLNEVYINFVSIVSIVVDCDVLDSKL
jgi:hypothetical protein